MMKNQLKITEIATLRRAHGFPNYQIYWFQILITRIKDLSEDSVNILYLYLLYFSRN